MIHDATPTAAQSPETASPRRPMSVGVYGRELVAIEHLPRHIVLLRHGQSAGQSYSHLADPLYAGYLYSASTLAHMAALATEHW